MAETLRPQLPAGARIAVGVVVVLLCLGLIAIGLTPSMSATPGMGIVGVPAGLVFACGGVLVLLPERLARPLFAAGAAAAADRRADDHGARRNVRLGGLRPGRAPLHRLLRRGRRGAELDGRRN